MKPSEVWKQINEKQFWQHLPSNYHSHTAVENESKNPYRAVTLRVNLSAQEMAYLKQWKGSNKHFYPTLEPSKAQHMESLTIVVSNALRQRLDSQLIGGKQRTASNKLRFLLTNSTQLSFNDYFKPLINLKPKNPSRKEVI